MDFGILSLLSEPVNLCLLGVCAFLLYKILGGSSSPNGGEEREPEVEKVEGDMTVKQLLAYDGKNKSKPVLLAVCGKIYNVTRGKAFYGPGGPYDVLAGHDATRALALMSTDKKDVKDVDDDTSDLTPGQMSSARDWQQSFEFKYDFVGNLVKETTKQEETEQAPAETSNAN